MFLLNYSYLFFNFGFCNKDFKSKYGYNILNFYLKEHSNIFNNNAILK